jgi:glycerol-3-phosphate dehydrogenase
VHCFSSFSVPFETACPSALSSSKHFNVLSRYYDGQHNDARANVCLAMTAAKVYSHKTLHCLQNPPSTSLTFLKHGGVVLNHTRFEGFQKNGAQITGVHCVDDLDGTSFQIKAKAVINATGPYSDKIRKLDDPSVKELCVPSAGVLLPCQHLRQCCARK